MFPATETKEERPKAATPKEETKVKRGPVPKAEAPVNATPSASLLPQAATPEDLEAISLTCMEKEIELELILEKWQVSRLEELDGPSAQQVREWLKGQYPERSPLRAASAEYLGPILSGPPRLSSTARETQKA